MPDITMCYGTLCPKQGTCYRAQAIPNQYRQSYFFGSPIDEEGECRYYIPTVDTDTIKEKTHGT